MQARLGMTNVLYSLPALSPAMFPLPLPAGNRWWPLSFPALFLSGRRLLIACRFPSLFGQLPARSL